MKQFAYLIILSFLGNLYGQNTPMVQLNDSIQLKLSILRVDVKIIGNFATTTYDMKFYNEFDRTLEGELVFPLGEGQAVSGFAMDVNGEMREAVIVEKELARVAYESTVRQSIDPGLLEKTQGNNYKARIYPILPNSYKHVKIIYEQELYSKTRAKRYQLPLDFKTSLDEFSIDIKVYGSEKPRVNNPELVFVKKDNKYEALFDKTNYEASSSIIIDIPINREVNQLITYDNFFYINQQLAPNSRLKKKPKSITILWDSSFSNNYRKIKKEIELLDLYFSYLQNAKVQFVSFSNDVIINKEYTIVDGNWSILKERIEEIPYDGGTSLRFLDTMRMKSDEVILFSDGLINLGSFTEKINKSIYTINSSTSGNHRDMNSIATISGGNYINLTRFSSKEALEILKHETYQFLGIAKNNEVLEVYPNQNTNVLSDFSLSGKFIRDTTIKLLFGYRNKITKEIEIFITNTSDDSTVKRLWAKQKLKTLSKDVKENEKKILSLAKQFKLITEYTSMLILDRIEDYVTYRIEPPQELRSEYKERIASIEEEEEYKKEELEERREELLEGYKDIWTWYTTKFPKKIKKEQPKATTEINNNSSSSSEINTAISQEEPINPIDNTNQEITETSSFAEENDTELLVVIKTNVIDATKKEILGLVTDKKGIPWPGVNIIIRGTTVGTQTDFDGNFKINVEINQELEISYLGYKSKTITIGDARTMQIKIESDTAELDEVVIIGYGTQTKKSVTASISTVSSQSFSEAVAGVRAYTTESEENSSIRVRGVSSIDQSSQPLYVIDGVLVQGNAMDQLSPDIIESVQVLKEASGIAIYGARGNNGVVIITTKEGKENNSEKIEELNQKISEKIELKSWNPNTPYIKILEEEKTIDDAYTKYLEIRKEYTNTPSFYLDVSDFFNKKEASLIAVQILTNLIEVDLDNHELMKALAYKLEYFGRYDLAVIVYKKVLELRPEEPQSYRDLALAYESIGEYQKSFDLLYKIYHGDLLEKDKDERFLGIEQLAYVELSRLIYRCKSQLAIPKSLENKIKKTPVDIRVVIDWNHNDTDLDLWVIDPNEEKGYYSNSETNIGGRLSEDITEGYGPEEFMLKKAIHGNYKVMIDYFDDNVQKISGPAVLKITMFTNYGRKNEEKKISIVRLDKQEEEIEVGNLKF